MQDIAEEIVQLQAEVDREIQIRKCALGVEVVGRIVGFERGVLDAQRQLRASMVRFIAQSELVSWLTAPVIYSLIVPFVLVDLWVSLYQAILLPGLRYPAGSALELYPLRPRASGLSKPGRGAELHVLFLR